MSEDWKQHLPKIGLGIAAFAAAYLIYNCVIKSEDAGAPAEQTTPETEQPAAETPEVVEAPEVVVVESEPEAPVQEAEESVALVNTEAFAAIIKAKLAQAEADILKAAAELQQAEDDQAAAAAMFAQAEEEAKTAAEEEKQANVLNDAKAAVAAQAKATTAARKQKEAAEAQAAAKAKAEAAAKAKAEAEERARKEKEEAAIKKQQQQKAEAEKAARQKAEAEAAEAARKAAIKTGELALLCQRGIISVNTDTFGKMDPYVEFSISDGKKVYWNDKTKIHESGHQAPKWDQKFVIPVKDYNHEITFVVKEKDSMVNDDVIGTGKFRPVEYQKETTTKEYQRAFDKDKETAQIFIQATWTPKE